MARIDLDDQEMRRKLDLLTPKQYKKIFRDATKESIKILKDQAVVNLRSELSSPKMLTKKDKYGKSLKQGIIAKAYKDGDGGIVHIMGNYKLKWFENGTQDRYKKNKAYTGRMRDTNFFTKAKNSTESRVFDSIEKHVTDSLNEILN